jgi:predicted nuclease of predicted toxin-antitoxin system
MRFLADENFDERILRGVQQKNPAFDVMRVQDTEVYQADDPTVLAWAAKEGRILLTRDVNTMIGFAYKRVEAGQPMPGVIEIRRRASISDAINALLTVLAASSAADWENQVIYLPLR